MDEDLTWLHGGLDLYFTLCYTGTNAARCCRQFFTFPIGKEREMTDITDKKLALARRMADGINEPVKSVVYGIIALLSGDEEDRKKIGCGVPANRVILIEVLLGLGIESEALSVMAGFSFDQLEEKSEAYLSFVFFLVDRGRAEEALKKAWCIVNPEKKARAYAYIAEAQKKLIDKQAEEAAELRRKLASAESGAAQESKTTEL